MQKKKKKKDLGKTNAWNKKQNLAGECKSCLHGVREIKPLDVKVTREWGELEDRLMVEKMEVTS